MTEPADDFKLMWEWFASHCHNYSPLYEKISIAVAGDPELLEMVRSCPPDAHLPPALLAAVHYLILGGVDHPLADVYAGRVNEDPGPPFLDLCREYRSEIASILATRHIQTNDCGRSALIGPGLTWLATQVEGPLALVDVGASAGLNLLCDRYRLNYGPAGSTGPSDSPVKIACEVKAGDPPIADRLPELVERVGIDRSPIDIGQADDARWLLACVWPDTGRLERIAASIHLAQEDPPRVVEGDANQALPGVLDRLPLEATAVVVTTWAFAYLSVEARLEFMELLQRGARRRTIAWLSAESAGTVPEFPGPAPDHPMAGSDMLGAVLFSQESRRPQLLAYVQEHGNWIDWCAPPMG
jgi:hypothetical protein